MDFISNQMGSIPRLGRNLIQSKESIRSQQPQHKMFRTIDNFKRNNMMDNYRNQYNLIHSKTQDRWSTSIINKEIKGMASYYTTASTLQNTFHNKEPSPGITHQRTIKKQKSLASKSQSISKERPKTSQSTKE